MLGLNDYLSQDTTFNLFQKPWFCKYIAKIQRLLLVHNAPKYVKGGM